MAAIIFPATSGPTGAGQLIETLTRGGVAVCGLSSGVAGNYFAAPMDEQRSYIAFSLAPGAADCVVSPGNDTDGIGFPLTTAAPRVEFAGKALECLVKGQWNFATDPGSTIHIVAVRGVC